MKATIKILHTAVKTSKKGTRYKKVLVLVSIDGNEFIETKYIFIK